jgi:hypothetical protein
VLEDDAPLALDDVPTHRGVLVLGRGAVVGVRGVIARGHADAVGADEVVGTQVGAVEVLEGYAQGHRHPVDQGPRDVVVAVAPAVEHVLVAVEAVGTFAALAAGQGGDGGMHGDGPGGGVVHEAGVEVGGGVLVGVGHGRLLWGGK